MDCNHEVVYNGLCALCGSDVESSEGQTHINMSHDSRGITVSRQEAERLEKENAERLLSSRKLSLILDLDQTVVHATWDPTVGEWMNDENNANHPATKDIRKFTLPGSHFVYYIKLRPGLSEFLETVSKLYELHIYTMGTRHYAEAVAREIDSTGKLFRNRILSRDESGSVTQKKIQRLFPCDTSMVVVLDDRSDVWSFSPNLIRIKPYEFFVGTGDINSPFAPRQPPDQDTLAKVKPLPLPETKTENEKENLESKGDDEEDEEEEQEDESTRKKALDQQEKLQEAMAQEQQEARPLAQQQSTQDRPLLVDDDRELYTMIEILKEIHQRFYNDEGRYERSKTDGAGSLQPKPDVTALMPAMKKKVLEGVHIVFTGLIPQHQTLSSSAIWQLAESFGATCLPDLTGNVTHVVAARAGTDKVHRAQRIPNVHIVSEAWLSDSTARWKKQDEAQYALPELAQAANEVENPESTPLEFDDEEKSTMQLMRAGPTWVTPIPRPAPRRSCPEKERGNGRQTQRRNPLHLGHSHH
ncbi:HAD-like domain-containing protein [Syncephalastrum racemosum]|uniref:RNA polymerase II subunit A C-terminal domain phosphatase n=1 Tax=Syncephalastrum racemosum TaxID=13706 RepID=A0A1X2H444_SYNRA|nr:HAD-like domain-containing protein [Syncephalastrum racemosum]